MTPENTFLQVRLATSEQDVLAAERLRYRVFVEELGGDGPLVDHALRLERDEFGAVADHLVLVDSRRDAGALEHVVGVYRLFPGDRAAAFGRFYCDGEYDLTRLRGSGLGPQYSGEAQPLVYGGVNVPDCTGLPPEGPEVRPAPMRAPGRPAKGAAREGKKAGTQRGART